MNRTLPCTSIPKKANFAFVLAAHLTQDKIFSSCSVTSYKTKLRETESLHLAVFAHAGFRVDLHSRGRSVEAKLTAATVTSYMWRVKREASLTLSLSKFLFFTPNNSKIYPNRK